MSINTTAVGAHGALESTGRAGTRGFWGRLFDKMIEARQAQARRQIAAYLSQLSDEQRKDLGYPTATDRR